MPCTNCCNHLETILPKTLPCYPQLLGGSSPTSKRPRHLHIATGSDTFGTAGVHEVTLVSRGGAWCEIHRFGEPGGGGAPRLVASMRLPWASLALPHGLLRYFNPDTLEYPIASFARSADGVTLCFGAFLVAHALACSLSVQMCSPAPTKQRQGIAEVADQG